MAFISMSRRITILLFSMLTGSLQKIILRICKLIISSRINQTLVNKKFNIANRMRSFRKTVREEIHTLLILKTMVKIILAPVRVQLTTDIKGKIFNQVQGNYQILVLKLFNNKVVILKQKRLSNLLILKNQINL